MWLLSQKTPSECNDNSQQSLQFRCESYKWQFCWKNLINLIEAHHFLLHFDDNINEWYCSLSLSHYKDCNKTGCEMLLSSKDVWNTDKSFKPFTTRLTKGSILFRFYWSSQRRILFKLILVAVSHWCFEYALGCKESRTTYGSKLLKPTTIYLNPVDALQQFLEQKGQ